VSVVEAQRIVTSQQATTSAKPSAATVIYHSLGSQNTRQTTNQSRTCNIQTQTDLTWPLSSDRPIRTSDTATQTNVPQMLPPAQSDISPRTEGQKVQSQRRSTSGDGIWCRGELQVSSLKAPRILLSLHVTQRIQSPCTINMAYRTKRGTIHIFGHLMDTLIQWNLHGLQANRDELYLLLSFYKPTVIALQETMLSKHHNINYSNYFFYSTTGIETNGTFHSGTALVIDETVPHKLLTLQQPELHLLKPLQYVVYIFLPHSDGKLQT